MTENDVTWPEVTRCDWEATPLHRNWPGKGCRKPKTHLFSAFQLLQGCNSQEVAVT